MDFIGNLNENLDIVLRDKIRVKKLLSKISDKDLSINISIYKKNRSNRQNRYLWGVIVPIVKNFILETDGKVLSKDETYYYIHSEVLGNRPSIVNIMGKDVICMGGKRFSEMNTSEFNESVEMIIQYFSILDCEIPYPNEENFFNNFL